MDKSLTPLEAVILGMYVCGMRWLVWFSYPPSLRKDFIFCQKSCKREDGTFAAEGKIGWLYNDKQLEDTVLCVCKRDHGRMKLLPWLQAHNVPIPEVSDAK